MVPQVLAMVPSNNVQTACSPFMLIEKLGIKKFQGILLKLLLNANPKPIKTYCEPCGQQWFFWKILCRSNLRKMPQFIFLCSTQDKWSCPKKIYTTNPQFASALTWCRYLVSNHLSRCSRTPDGYERNRKHFNFSPSNADGDTFENVGCYFQTQEAKRISATHSDTSVEIMDPRRHLKPWSEIWLTLFEIPQQLSIKSLLKKSNWDKYLPQGLIPENLMSIIDSQVTPSCCPMFKKFVQ